ncbi:MAG: saccharopine dehydrogenase family protein [Candidatus Woesearchaeota archaeon]
MNVLILGLGAQGKATLFDIVQNKDIRNIVVVENNPAQIAGFISRINDSRVKVTSADANSREEMLPLLKEADIIIDLLPTPFRKHIAEMAIEAGTDLVNTSFRHHIESCAPAAALKGVRIIPEAGLDPGIDLVLAGNAISRFDKIEEFRSACGGVPVKEACDNPINYKVSWIFEGVLGAYTRPADILVNGEIIHIDGDKIFDHSEEVELEGIGRFDRYPNGNASSYAALLGITGQVKDMGRYTLRWPGHSDFWKKIVALGLISDDPVLGMSPRKFMSKVLEPRLQYKDDEQDMVVLINDITGIKDGKRKHITQTLVDKRDLDTGFMAMNRTVGFTASIVAQMVLSGKIKGKGILNSAKDIPYDYFIAELVKRGITVEEKEE